MRPDLDVIAAMVPRGARVLDVGCGDGALLEHLITRLGCEGQGVDRSSESFAACVARGVPVVQADLDAGLEHFADDSFDVAILSLTLQATAAPSSALRELMRLAPVGIVSVPNFGHWRLRADLALRGRMPVSRQLPHPWYSTPNIHLCTVRDLRDLLAEEGLRVTRTVALDERGVRAANPLVARAANLLAAAVALRIEPRA